MVSLPRTCPHCDNRLMHYGACSCPMAFLQQIRDERQQLQKRLICLEKLEYDALSKVSGLDTVR